MKTGIVLFSVLLLLWIAGSSYVYVCKVRNDCCTGQIAADSLQVQEAITADTLQSAAADVIPEPPLYTVYFDFNQSTSDITAECNSHFALVKTYLDNNPEKKVGVTGHSDITGPGWAKVKVSAARAEYIKQKLVESGVGAAVVDATAESDSKPVSDNNTAEGRAKNRRVEIQIQ